MSTPATPRRKATTRKTAGAGATRQTQPVEVPAVAPARKKPVWTDEMRAAMRAKMLAKYNPDTEEGQNEVAARKADAANYWNSPEGIEKREAFRVMFKARYAKPE